VIFSYMAYTWCYCSRSTCEDWPCGMQCSYCIANNCFAFTCVLSLTKNIK
jgi:hypothetical protein